MRRFTLCIVYLLLITFISPVYAERQNAYEDELQDTNYISVYNDYIKFRVNPSGMFSIADNNFKNILDNYNSPQFTGAYIFQNGTKLDVDTNSYEEIKPSNDIDRRDVIEYHATYTHGNSLKVNQDLEIVYNSRTGKKDTLKISYTLMNTSVVSPREIGFKFFLDTRISGVDAPGIYIPEHQIGVITNETELNGDEVPKIWYSNEEAVTGVGTLYKLPSEKPDTMMIVSNTGMDNITTWKPEISGNWLSSGDTAVLLLWNPRTIDPGESVTYTTYYGTHEFDTSYDNNYMMTVDYEDTLRIDEETGFYRSNYFDVSAYIKNISSSVKNPILTLLVNQYMSLTTVYPASQNVSLQPGEEKIIRWRVFVYNNTAAEERRKLSVSVNSTAVTLTPEILCPKIVYPPYTQNVVLGDTNGYRNVSYSFTKRVKHYINEQLYLEADIAEVISGKKVFKGNVTINSYLRLAGEITVDIQTKSIEGNGILFVDATQDKPSYEYYNSQIDLYQGSFIIASGSKQFIPVVGEGEYLLNIAGTNVYASRFIIGTDGIDATVRFDGQSTQGLDIKLKDGMFTAQNSITHNDLNIGKSDLVINNISVSYDADKNALFGNGELNIPGLYTLPVKLTITDGKITEVLYEHSDLGTPIGSGDFILTGINAHVQGIDSEELNFAGDISLKSAQQADNKPTIEANRVAFKMSPNGTISINSGEIVTAYSSNIVVERFEINTHNVPILRGSLSNPIITSGMLDICVSSDFVSGKLTNATIVPPVDTPLIKNLNISVSECIVIDDKITGRLVYRGLESEFFYTSDQVNAFNMNIPTISKYTGVTTPAISEPFEVSVHSDSFWGTFNMPPNVSVAIIHLSAGELSSDLIVSSPSYTYSRGWPTYENNGNETYLVLERPEPGSYICEASNGMPTVFKVSFPLGDASCSLELNNDKLMATAEQGWTKNIYRTIHRGNTTFELVNRAVSTDYSPVQNAPSEYICIATNPYRSPVRSEQTIYLSETSPQSKPENIAVDIKNKFLLVSWDPTPDTELYEVMVTSAQGVVAGVTDKANIKMAGLPAGLQLDVKVSSINESGVRGAFSTEDIKTTIVQPINPFADLIWGTPNINTDILTIGGYDRKFSTELIINNKPAVYVNSLTSVTIKLRQGINKLVLKTRNANGDEYIAEKVYTLNKTAPFIELEDFVEGMTFINNSVSINGKLSHNLSSFTINGTEVAVDDNSFRYITSVSTTTKYITITAVKGNTSTTLILRLYVIDSAKNLPNVSIMPAKITDQFGGESIAIDPYTSNYLARTQVENRSGKAVTITLIIGGYDEYGRPVSVEQQTTTISNNSTVSIECALNVKPTAVAELRAYIWSRGQLIPLSNKITIN